MFVKVIGKTLKDSV